MLVVVFRGINIYAGTLTILRVVFGEVIPSRSHVGSGRNNTFSTGVKLHEFNENEPVGNWLLRELTGWLMWLPNQTRPYIANAVSVVAGYTNMPREVNWTTAVGI